MLVALFFSKAWAFGYTIVAEILFTCLVQIGDGQINCALVRDF